MCGRSDQTSLKYWKDMVIINIIHIEKFANLLLTQEKCYTVEIRSKYEHALLEDISKAYFIKTKRIKITQPLNSEFDNEIMFLITVYK